MTEYISRDDALLHSEIIRVYSKDYGNIDVVPVEYLADIPAADVQPVDRWISVDDKLPEEIGYYLVVIGNEMLISIDIAEYSEGYWHKHDKVLFWQPLPDYPESTKG